MSFLNAVNHCYRYGFDWRGRACRSEFWWFALFGLLMPIAAIKLVIMLGPVAQSSPLTIVVFGFVQLAVLIPGLAVLSRRLHDLAVPGWLTLTPVAYFAGVIVLATAMPRIQGLPPQDSDMEGVAILGILVGLVFLSIPVSFRGTIGPNKFGPDPIEVPR